MGKYNSQYSREPEREWKVHPVWRGIGFVLIILVLFMSAIGAREMANANRANQWISTAGGMDAPVNLVFKTEFSPKPINLNGLINWMPGYPFRVSEIIFFFAFLLLGFGFIWTVYAVMWRAVGPPRDPRDAPEYDRIRMRNRRR